MQKQKCCNAKIHKVHERRCKDNTHFFLRLTFLLQHRDEDDAAVNSLKARGSASANANLWSSYASEMAPFRNTRWNSFGFSVTVQGCARVTEAQRQHWSWPAKIYTHTPQSTNIYRNVDCRWRASIWRKHISWKKIFAGEKWREKKKKGFHNTSTRCAFFKNNMYNQWLLTTKYVLIKLFKKKKTFPSSGRKRWVPWDLPTGCRKDWMYAAQNEINKKNKRYVFHIIRVQTLLCCSCLDTQWKYTRVKYGITY